MTDERTDPGAATDDDAQTTRAAEVADERDRAKEKMHEMEQGDPPDRLEDWPDDAAKYETFGGPEGEHSYDEGPESKLGPASVRHHEDGGVTVEGEAVDNPDDFKGDPIPGGPTDPDSVENRDRSDDS